jgi:hypothetical protein
VDTIRQANPGLLWQGSDILHTFLIASFQLSTVVDSTAKAQDLLNIGRTGVPKEHFDRFFTHGEFLDERYSATRHVPRGAPAGEKKISCKRPDHLKKDIFLKKDFDL